nr:unnamed protein product [Callosobruchus analis]
MSKVSQKSNMKRRHYLMAQDNSSAYGDYPKPKKSKTSQDIIYSSFWAQLPSLLLHNVFDLLSDEDRRNASLVCKHWRQNSFHPKWWTKMTFRIEENNLEKARFIIYTFGKIVTDARIVVNSLSQECMEEFIQLLRLLSDNNNLRSLYLEPTHCRFEAPYKCFNSNEDDPWGIIPLLLPCLPNLVKFSIGCIEDLCYFIEDILKHLDPTKVTHLGLASVKDDPINYQPCCFDPELLAPFNKLEVLSIDYDMLTDHLLKSLDSTKQLQRLVVHLHAVPQGLVPPTNRSWLTFRQKHPKCELRLTAIHTFKDIDNLHETVLREQMPLSHIKLFFCEKVNLELIQNLTNYSDTLRSITLIDSQSDDENSWSFTKPIFDQSPDPFVLAAWLCKRLEEFVMFGYKYKEENLVAIGRLRGEKLKKLVVAESDIIFSHMEGEETALLDIPSRMQKPWKPVQLSDLHPVISSPNDGDSDEYLLPIVLADLY